jgi:hypothetical protein
VGANCKWCGCMLARRWFSNWPPRCHLTAPFEVLASRARRNVSCATLDQPALQKDR